MKKKILLVGSEGLIGNAIYNFLKKKYDVYAVDKIPSCKNSFYYQCNVGKNKDVQKLFKNFKKKKIYFSTIINATYPKPKKKLNLFLDYDNLNFKISLQNHLMPFYIFLINSYLYYLSCKRVGQVISFSSIYGSKIPNFKIYKNTNIKSPIYYSAAKASLNILSKYLSQWAKFKRKEIFFTTISPAGVKNNQSKKFQLNYKAIYKKNMLDKNYLAKKILPIILNPKKYNGKDVIISNGIIL